jgi:hypothetical protein
MHRQHLTDATREFFVERVAMLAKRFCKLCDERIAQQDQVVQSFGRGQLRHRS